MSWSVSQVSQQLGLLSEIGFFHDDFLNLNVRKQRPLNWLFLLHVWPANFLLLIAADCRTFPWQNLRHRRYFFEPWPDSWFRSRNESRVVQQICLSCHLHFQLQVFGYRKPCPLRFRQRHLQAFGLKARSQTPVQDVGWVHWERTNNTGLCHSLALAWLLHWDWRLQNGSRRFCLHGGRLGYGFGCGVLGSLGFLG